MPPVLPDSNVWISWLTNDAGASRFEALFAPGETVLVPTIIVYEVTRWLLVRKAEAVARIARERMERMRLVPLNASIASAAATLATEHRLALADAIILATARQHRAVVWTQDQDFLSLHDVKHFPKLG